MQTTKVTIYRLYAIDQYERTRFIGRYGSKHRLFAAIQGLGISRYFYETEEKQCEYGGTLNLRQVKRK